MAIPPSQAGVAEFLQGLAGAPPGETHISAVFRGADTVWKLKKAVRLGFLDFSTVADRRRFLDRELALNAPLVPGLYRDVVPVTGTAGAYAFGGDGPAADWVLRMARVPEPDFLDAMADAGRLTPALLAAIADVVAAMHAHQQPIGRATGEAAQFRAIMQGNAQAARAAGIPDQAVDAWQAALNAALDRAAPLLQARAPLVRRAHADLHLGNMLMWHGAPAPFDALEFDEDLATIDPGYDLAFLLMDLERRVSRAAANRVLCRYVARTGDAGLVGGLPVFLSMRAMVRAHVEAARGRPFEDLLHAAMGALIPGRSTVVAIGGLMGTGKSTLARAIAPMLGPAPGALVLRSDEIRKRLFGIPPEARLPPQAYGPAANEATNVALLDGLRAAVRGGHAVVLDATFLDPTLRARIRDATPAPFLGVWLHAPLPLLEARVAARRNDASDATVAVLRSAALGAQPPDDWLRIDAGNPATPTAEQTVQAALAML